MLMKTLFSENVGQLVRVALGGMALASRLSGQISIPVVITPISFASLSGTVRDESNLPVEATVTIFTQGLRREALTASSGIFLFPNLKTGKYAICAVPTATAATAQNPFVDSCLWQDRTSLQVPLAPGQNRQGVIVPVRHGYPLHIRVNDPAPCSPRPLASSAATTSPSTSSDLPASPSRSLSPTATPMAATTSS